VLPGISTEQLRSRLNRMVADGMLTRKRYREVPPRVDYELTDRARELMPILGELARWGYEWAWSRPRASEVVDIGAIFRLAPGLVHETTGRRGQVEFAIDDDARSEGGPASYTFTISDLGVGIEESPTDGADARVHGTTAAWIDAFSPNGDRSQLQVTGDRTLVDSLLDRLALASEHSSDAARAVG
jgi:hypothetical protein